MKKKKNRYEKQLDELIKDNSGKIIFAFLVSCIFMPQDEFDKFIKSIDEDFKKEKTK